MRILHVLDHSLPLHSGYSFRTRAIMRAQQAQGLEVRGITSPRHTLPQQGQPSVAAEECDGLLFHRSQGSSEGPVLVREWREIRRFARAIDNLVRDWRPDVIHAHSPALCGEAALRVARENGLPLVYEIRAFWEDAAVSNGASKEGSIRYVLTRGLENRVVSAADAVFVICDGLREDLIKRGANAGKIGVSPNGVDLALFGKPAQRDDALAQKIGLGKGPVIGFVGSFYDYEGLDDLIAAMPLLQERHEDSQLLLVGGGPREEALHRQASAAGCENSVIFTGRVPHEDVEKYYALIDILAYPRKRSRLTDLVTPLKPLEAMAQHRLVAASDVGGHRELITDGETGVLFAADNPASCAEALTNLIDRPHDWDRIRANASAHVRANHDWARNVERYSKVYRAIAARADNAPMQEVA